MTSKNFILIAGYGYIGKRLEQSITNSIDTVITLSSTTYENKTNHLGINLDSEEQSLELKNFNKLHNKLTIVYLIPPPNSKQIDSRIKNFFELIKEYSTAINKIILISTTAVYGDYGGAWITEEQPLSPQSDRAFRRIDAEHHSQQFCSSLNIPLIILRVAGIYAHDKLPLERIKQQKPILQEEDAPYSNRIHAEDLVNIILHSIKNDVSGIFNCCDSSPSTMSSYFIQLAQAFNLPQPPQITRRQAEKELSAGMLSYMNESRRLSNEKLLSTLNISLKYPSLDIFLNELKHLNQSIN